MKVCFDTFGCRLNRAEALQQEARFVASGWEVTKSHADADAIVVRCCAVTARAQRDCEKLITHLQKKYPNAKLLIEGCTDKRIRSAIIERTLIKEADAPVSTRTARAYLKVQDGCSGKCTFCIVPQFRGKSVSVDFEEAIGKANRFIEAGYREIVVTGCNLSLYASNGKRLPDLLAALAALNPSTRIRLGSLEPGICDDEAISVMAENANICRFLHLPIQSGSNVILSAMRRPYLIRDIDKLVRKAVELMPNLGLGCDLMTGFPGESQFDFLATQTLLKRLPFNNAHIFAYSERPGTTAAKFSNQIPRDIRSERAHELAKIADLNRANYAKKFIGRKVAIIIEDEERGIGWTGEYLRCETMHAGIGSYRPKRRELVTFRISETKNGVLRGLPISPHGR